MSSADGVGSASSDLAASASRLAEQLRGIAQSMAAAKNDNGDAGAAKDSERSQKRLYAKGSVAMMELKSRSRNVFCAAAELLESLDAAKKATEERQLSLQNLLYEKAYLGREIERCRKFEMREFTKIDLVSKEEFEKSAPEALLQDIRTLEENSGEQQHQINLSRLSHELQLRRDLQTKLKELREDVKTTKETTSDRLAFLDDLPRKMQDIVKATKPVEDHFGERIIDRLARHDLCKQLPEPLYMIYCQLEAYGDSFGGVTLDIGKDENLIALAKRKAASEELANGKTISVSGSHAMAMDAEENTDSSHAAAVAAMNKRRRADSTINGGDHTDLAHDDVNTAVLTSGSKRQRKEDFHQDSGFSIMAKLASPNRRVDVTLVFKYYKGLGVATVEAVNQRGLLANIYPNDTGQFLPRTTLDRTISQGPKQVFAEDRPDRPYKWLQWLSGNYTLPPESPEYNAQPSMGSIIQSILDRVGAQEALSEQLHALKKCPHPVPVHPSAESLFPSNALARLVKWEEIGDVEADDLIASTFADRASGAPIFYRRQDANNGPGSSSWASFGRRCFHGILETSEKGKVEAIVQVFVDYPKRAPHFTLLPTTNSTLRIIQTEINDHADELRAADQLRLLSHQLRRLQMCLDVMSAASSASATKSTTAGDMDEGEDMAANTASTSSGSSMMDRKLRGRDRRLAFVYDPASRSFTHR